MYRRQLALQQALRGGQGFFRGILSKSPARKLETNYYDPLLLSRAFRSGAGEQWRRSHVNILSSLSWVAVPDRGTNSASKAATWALTNWRRPALRGHGTRVLGAHTGPVDTEMTSNLTVPEVKPVDVVRQVLNAFETGRDEVLVDKMTWQVKARLSNELGIYLDYDPEQVVQR